MSNGEKKPFELVRFLWKHKNEILGAAVCVAVTAYAWYELGKKVVHDEEKHEEDLRIPIEATVSSPRQRPDVISRPVENSRSQELSRIHTLFDKVIRILIPIIRAKVNDTIDVNSAIRKIKELRCEFKSEVTDDDQSQDVDDEQDRTDMRITEAMLWEEVKVSSLTLLFVSTYLVSAVTIVLRMYLHRMRNTTTVFGHRRDVSSVDTGVDLAVNDVDNNDLLTDTSNDHLLDQYQLEQLVQSLLDGPFKHFFDQGIETLTRDIQQQVVLTFAGWNVQDKVSRPSYPLQILFPFPSFDCIRITTPPNSSPNPTPNPHLPIPFPLLGCRALQRVYSTNFTTTQRH